MNAFHPHLLDRRLRVARAAVWGAVTALVVVFFKTQILEHSKYQLQSETNRLRQIPLPAPRGIITDRNGKILAENVTGYTVALLPDADEDSVRATLMRIAPILKLDNAAIERVLIGRYLGVDTTLTSSLRIVLPTDTAPRPMQLLPGPASEDTTLTPPDTGVTPPDTGALPKDTAHATTAPRNR